MDGRGAIWSTSVSAGVLNETLSLEYLESLSVRVRDVVNEDIPANAGEIDLSPRWSSGIGGGDNAALARSMSSPPDSPPGVEAAFRTV